MTIILDENGNVIDPLDDRNEEIKLRLRTALEVFREEAEKDKRGFKKFGYRLTTQIDNVLRSYGLMSAEKFTALDYDTLEDLWNKFRDLIAYYNLFFEVIGNKQLFCAFAGLNSRMYSQLEKHKDEDIRELMQSINDYFIGMGFSSAETGNVDSKATKLRLGAKEVGHSVVSASEELAVQTAQALTPLEMKRQMAQILGTDMKQLK